MATKTLKTRFFAVAREIAESEKCPPQAVLIVKTVAAAGGRIARTELLNLLRRPTEEGGLATRQSAERILSFYRPRLMEAGILVEETEESTVEIPDPPKKEKAPKAPKEAPAVENVAGTPAAPKADKKVGKKGKKVVAEALVEAPVETPAE